MMDPLIITIACSAAAFLLGFLVAWLFRKPAVNIKALQAENEVLKTAGTSLETSNRYLTEQQSLLAGQLDTTRENLLQLNRAVAEYEAKLNSMNELVTMARKDQATEKENHWQTKQDAIRHQNDLHRMKAELKYKDEQLAHQKEELLQASLKMEKEFSLLAQKILDDKTASFHKQQEKSLADVLNPLKENIQQFKQEFEQRYNKESEERISLREHIRHITDTNKLLSEQANNLTNALRGQVKQQGNWGEMILESILEHAGLVKDQHYFVQQQVNDEAGNRLLPDVIVRYPDNRSIIIDSKVSLVHYEQYCSCTDAAQQGQYLNSLMQSLYRHIDNLGSKKYQDAVGALDFVLLFVPVEGAYITVMQADTSLWQYAYKKRVLLISPTNLIAAMKLVHDLWKKEYINVNAQEIAAKAVKIYEKLAAFAEDFEKIGSQLERATTSYHEAQKKLVTGKGNVIKQALDMKAQLNHNRPNRELPAGWIEQAEEN
jgi:DNA recombination protein RmuC